MTKLLALALIAALQQEVGDYRWPLGPGNKTYPLRATYGQLEGDEADWWFVHKGLDIVGNVQQQTVYAVEAGTVVRVRRNSAEDSAVLVESETIAGRGFLYLHLDKASIDVCKGCEVKVGDRLGRIAKKNTAAGEPHLHLARLGGEYVDHDWGDLSDLGECNPLVLLKKGDPADDQAPTFVKVPGGSKYIGLREDDNAAIRLGEGAGGPQPVEASAGWFDVVVNVHDTDAVSTHLVAPRLLRLEIRSGTDKTVFRPIVLDGALPDDQIDGLYDFSTEYHSAGDTQTHRYDYFFIPTNTGQDGTSIRAWKPARGDYVIHVEVQDAAGNTQTLDEPVTIP